MQVVNKQQAIMTLEMLSAPHQKVVDAFLARFPTPTEEPEALKMIKETHVLRAATALFTYRIAVENLLNQ